MLFVSLAAHAAQFAFLVFFENPRECQAYSLYFYLDLRLIQDIKRMYGKRKAIAKRTPLPSSSLSTPSSKSSTPPPITYRLASKGQEEQQPDHDVEDLLSTSAATEGDTFTETEMEPETTETEMDDQIQPETKIQQTSFLPGRHSSTQMAQIPSMSKLSSRTRHQPQASITSLTSVSGGIGVSNNPRKRRGMSEHDLLNRYFRRDAVVLRNIDLLRYVHSPSFIDNPVNLLLT